MHLKPYDPWEQLLTIRRSILELFDDVFAEHGTPITPAWHRALIEIERILSVPQRPDARAFVPPVDLARTGRGFLLRVLLPGVSESALEIVLEHQSLVIRGEAEEPFSGPAQTLLRECPRGYFERRIELPEEADLRSLQAHLEEGVLEISIPLIGG